MCDFCSVPKHALGIKFAGAEGDCGPGKWRADEAVAVRNWVVEQRGLWDTVPPGGMKLNQVPGPGGINCATLSSGPNGGMNHVEIRVSQNLIEVWASDAGSRVLKKINTITDANLSFTRGLIWISTASYNAPKAGGTAIHTQSWDNVAFDGPVTYRDLSFDVLDRLAPTGTPNVVNLGWDTAPSSPVTLTTLPMTAANIAASTRALLMYNFGWTNHVNTFNYAINGHAVSVPNPVPLPLRGERSVSFEVPLSWLVAGPQNIVLSGDQSFLVRNVNIVLVSAAPVPPVEGTTPPGVPANLRIVP
jgi:hypothetical protein